VTLPAIGIVITFGFAGFVGWLCAHRWTASADLTAAERLFVWTSLGILVIGWIGVWLAEMGAFTLPWLVVLPLALGFACWSGTRIVLKASQPAERHRLDEAPGLPQRRQQLLLPAAVACWLVLLAVFYFRPHQYLTGGADAGVYVNLGVNLARTGRLLIDEPTLAGMDPALYPLFLRALPPSEGAPYNYLPGFYATNLSIGEITPQFYPLHTVWLGLATLVGELQAGLLTVPTWALLGVIAFYFTIRSWWGNGWGLLASGVLSLTSLQIWFARYPTSEMLTQFLFWTGAWAVGAWLAGRRPAGLWALVAGLALGEVLLTRIDMYVLLALPAAVALYSAYRSNWHKSDLCFYVPFGLLTAHSLAHAWFFARPYATRLWIPFPSFFQSHPKWLALVIAGGVAVFALLIVCPALWRPIAKKLPHLRQTVITSMSTMVILAMTYGYLVRPLVSPLVASPDWYGGGVITNLDPLNVVRLGWYIGLLGLSLATAGVVVCLHREVHASTLFVLAAGVFFSAYYLWRMMANPHQVYAMRRYVPVVIPFATAMAVSALRGLWIWPARWRRHLATALTLVWIVCILALGRGFVSQVDYAGVGEQLASLDAALEPNSIVVFGDSSPVGMGDIVGTPLRFLYQHPVLSIRRPELLGSVPWLATVARWQSEGREVVWIEPAGGIGWPGPASDLLDQRTFTISSDVLENTYVRKPQAIMHTDWQLTVSRVRRQ
jgi:hypothetical protein